MRAIPAMVVAVMPLRWPVLDRSAASESVDAVARTCAADGAGADGCAETATERAAGEAASAGPELDTAASRCAVTAAVDGGRVVGGWVLGVSGSAGGGAWVATVTAHSVFG